MTNFNRSLLMTDAMERQITFTRHPDRVVCLPSYITEMMTGFGLGVVLAGMSREDLLLNPGFRKPCIGSYFTPDIDRITACSPDLIIASPSHGAVIRHFCPGGTRVLIMEAGSLDEGFAHMEMIGQLFGCEDRARDVVRRNREQIALVAERLKGVQGLARRRVARVMAGKTLSCPGDDSFQNEMIIAAGGIPPRWGKTGSAVPVDGEAWQNFNPQFVYGCDLNQEEVDALLDQPPWKEVDAVRTRSVAIFPCQLTCRVSIHTGAFVQWLAARLYPSIMADPKRAVREDAVLAQTPLAVDHDYVDDAFLVTHRVWDAEYKTLAVRFKRPLNVISTLEGPKPRVLGVGNTHVPMHASLGHMARGITRAQKAIADNLGFEAEEYAGLMTGADMDNLTVIHRADEDLKVTAFVTAGVRGNALRVAEASAPSPTGTINIIVMANRKLTPGAMTWALVVITEAKSSALQDLDIRSTQSPLLHGATGTGTDTVIVVEGEGEKAPYAGGHTRLGQMIAGAVHEGVTRAISKQNGIRADRGLVQRFDERKLRLNQIAGLFTISTEAKDLAARMEAVLADPYYASFMESALALSDAHRTGLVKDLAFWDATCAAVTARLADRTDIPAMDIRALPLPEVMAKALGALVAGITGGGKK